LNFTAAITNINNPKAQENVTEMIPELELVDI